MKVDVKTFRLPAFFEDPKDSYVPRLLLIRKVLFRVGPDQLKTGLRVLLDLCRNEYLKAEGALTHEAVQELVIATADLAFQLRLPSISMAETKNRLSAEMKWWNAWVDEEAGLRVADRVAPVTEASRRGEPHWLEVELERLGVGVNELYEKHKGPDPTTTRKIIAGRITTEGPFARLFTALEKVGSKIDRKTFDVKIAKQIRRPKSSRL